MLVIKHIEDTHYYYFVSETRGLCYATSLCLIYKYTIAVDGSFTGIQQSVCRHYTGIQKSYIRVYETCFGVIYTLVNYVLIINNYKPNILGVVGLDHGLAEGAVIGRVTTDEFESSNKIMPSFFASICYMKYEFFICTVKKDNRSCEIPTGIGCYI